MMDLGGLVGEPLKVLSPSTENQDCLGLDQQFFLNLGFSEGGGSQVLHIFLKPKGFISRWAEKILEFGCLGKPNVLTL
jgi:hypothetical protein